MLRLESLENGSAQNEINSVTVRLAVGHNARFPLENYLPKTNFAENDFFLEFYFVVSLVSNTFACNYSI